MPTRVPRTPAGKPEEWVNSAIARLLDGGEPRFLRETIETVALDPSDEKGALETMSGRVVSIGMLIDDGQIVTEITLADEDERQLITDFWRTVSPGDVLVGNNVLDFDLRFLRQRSWILGIQPSRKVDARKYYRWDVIDTLQLWTNWGNKKGVTLDALGFGGKTGNGANVAQWWAERDIDSIKNYCQEDVRLAYRVFCRLTYQESKQIPSALQPGSVGPASRRDRQVLAHESLLRLKYGAGFRGKTFGTFTDLLQHAFKLLEFFWRDVLERAFDKRRMPAEEG